ncbi:plasmid segregation protein ParM domain-containing protein [Bacillus taeanensis]|uniref:Actin-like protein N-terminal domain-containing protein n=1 Tax=Bacillus taeanensis TaxID=273032 RepID=A0A366XRS4_9BACI|nr:plasmid segregation protein ParM domain-containing protein [Bacillus taeanensis]RBW68238.1 hypothetical protein DS031_17845 [Bacillus taeanensis]
MKTFVFDVGNGFVKGKSVKKTFIAPSSIVKETSLGDSSISGLSSELNSETQYHTFQSPLDEGESYVWGEGIKYAVEASDLITTYTHNNRYESKRFKLLCEFILAELASDFEEEILDVIVVTGLPSKEVKTEDDKKLKNFLKGKHLVTRDGVEKVINVKDVRIIEQPLGTLLNLYMNDDSQLHKNLKTNTISVIDFGAGTTILDTFKNLKRLDTESDTYYEGMIDIYKSITNDLVRKHNIKGLDISLVEEGYQNDCTAKLSERIRYPFHDEADKAVKNFVEKIISNIDRTLSRRDHIDEFIVTGGGAHIIKDEFKKAFGEESLIIVKDAQLANVEGYFKFAQAIVKSQKAKKATTATVTAKRG